MNIDNENYEDDLDKLATIYALKREATQLASNIFVLLSLVAGSVILNGLLVAYIIVTN